MNRLLSWCETFGRRMHRIRHLLIVLIIALAFLTCRLLFVDSETSGRYLLPSFLLTTCLVLCLSFAHLADAVSRAKSRPEGWFRRIKHFFYRGFVYLLVLSFMATTLVLLYIMISTAIRTLRGM